METHLRFVIGIIGALVIVSVVMGIMINYLFSRLEEYEKEIEQLKSNLKTRLEESFTGIQKDIRITLQKLDSSIQKEYGDNNKILESMEQRVIRLENRSSGTEQRISRIKREDVDVRKSKGSGDRTGTGQ